MISGQELRKVAAARAVKDVAFMEKDYAITWALKAIYSNKDLSNMLIFKGGTCLSKIYGENYRLSEDLDFSTPVNRQPTPEWFEQHLSTAFEQAKMEGGPDLRVKTGDTHATPGHIIFQIQYNATLGHAGRLKLDVSL
ncbi:MAG: nucleotidyl transferase AbiEii/AbiGii toxin family protein [Candidatus Diapherotrites archaeon]|uniref:Nucleotidyl transferase AbiEii/AbiGii toxin family protein n=1 Tax=Candidatus Iainarchaeum sp. TaxID=3101447 RepID=A0A8T3YMM9_9ARCH|nr:nucleotidyl transferase AbiEii/AbiGii toxin family protein [Candidatus Diapherotrites archaeon]